MAVLTARELAVIDKIKKLTQSVTNREEFVREALGFLKTVIPFNSAAFFDVNPNTLEFTSAHLDNLGRDFLPLYFQKFYKREDTALGFSEFLKNGYVSKRGSELIDFKHHIYLPLYKELLRKYDCHFFLASGFAVNGQCFGYLILWRGQTERDFSKKHPEMMRLMAPSIADVLKSHQPGTNPSERQTISGEQRLLEIISQRTPPGVLILDPQNHLLYKNEEAQSVLYLLSKSWAHSGPAGNGHPGTVPVEILTFCNKLRATLAKGHRGKTEQIPCLTSTISVGSEVYSLRALLLDNGREPDEPLPIMVLIENISPAKRFDLERARDRYQLTFKEQEVVQLLFQGFTNKEVAKELCIGTYTLKDHLKNIRQKMGVGTRTGILSKVIHG